jgi:hypothetical protein
MNDSQQLLTALTTEHFTLQGARSQTMSESSARASVRGRSGLPLFVQSATPTAQRLRGLRPRC